MFAILDLPGGAFLGTGVKTVVLFFEKGKPTNKIWYYQLNLDRSIGKTKPLSEDDLNDFVNFSKTQELSKNSWLLEPEKINQTTYDLSVKNPNQIEEDDKRTVNEVISEINNLEDEFKKTMKEIKDLI